MGIFGLTSFIKHQLKLAANRATQQQQQQQGNQLEQFGFCDPFDLTAEANDPARNERLVILVDGPNVIPRKERLNTIGSFSHQFTQDG